MTSPFAKGIFLNIIAFPGLVVGSVTPKFRVDYADGKQSDKEYQYTVVEIVGSFYRCERMAKGKKATKAQVVEMLTSVATKQAAVKALLDAGKFAEATLMMNS